MALDSPDLAIEVHRELEHIFDYYCKNSFEASSLNLSIKCVNINRLHQSTHQAFSVRGALPRPIRLTVRTDTNDGQIMMRTNSEDYERIEDWLLRLPTPLSCNSMSKLSCTERLKIQNDQMSQWWLLRAPEKFNLAGLPFELRTEIYEHVTSDKIVIDSCQSEVNIMEDSSATINLIKVGGMVGWEMQRLASISCRFVVTDLFDMRSADNFLPVDRT